MDRPQFKYLTEVYVQITWLNDTNYVNLQAEMTGSKDSWIISFPRDPAALTRSLCTSSSGSCMIAPQTACTPDSAALKGAEVETMSIVEATSACSAGSAAASKDGMSLTYGLKVRLKPLLHLWGLITMLFLFAIKPPSLVQLWYLCGLGNLFDCLDGTICGCEVTVPAGLSAFQQYKPSHC